MKLLYTLLLGTIFQIVLSSCEEYLDAKPDQALAVPDKLKDLQAILDNETYMIQQYPDAGDIASDYYYLTEEDWASSNEDVRKIYLWDSAVTDESDWELSYIRVFYANVVLDQLRGMEGQALEKADRDRIKGSALFFRGWTFFQLTQLFAPPYDKDAIGLPGIPLRLSSDINDETVRASLEETYDRILTDLKEAASLLSERSISPTRPSKAAAYAALAKTYLVMGNYEEAENYADACLQIKNVLIDYNALDTAAENPFSLFNEEVIFHSQISAGLGALAPRRARVDSVLYGLYETDDLRRTVFFRARDDGSIAFKGDYTGASYGELFNGFATDEVYLIKAESQARLGNVPAAMETLNVLLKKRWTAGFFSPATANNTEESLRLILEERRKELCFRGGIRWSDLRRLNQDTRFDKTLVRIIGNERYELPPGDPRYTFLIPHSVIQQSGIEQNKR